MQISKLRFFISLVCEQTPNADPKLNYGINPLPNLETKFVAADSLVGLPIEEKDVLDMSTGYVPQLKLELWNIRKAHFNARTYSAKKELRKLDKQKRDEIKSVFKYTVLPDAEKLADLEKKRALVSEPDWQSLGTVRETQGVLFAEMAMEVKESQNIQYDANANRRKDLDTEISREKKKLSIPPTILDEIIDKLSDWDPYDQNTSATFFEPEWMFNVEDGFDIVIGNPPYFVLKNSHPYKRQYAQNFKHLKSGRINIYQLFFGVADKLISPDGIVTYIHPKTLLSDAYLLATRRFMIKNYRSFVMVNVVDRKKTFESVLQSVVVSTWIKGDAYKNCRIYEISQKGDLESFSFIHLPKASVMTMDGSLLVTKDMRVYALVKKTQSAFCRGLKFGTGNVEWNKYVNLLCAVPQPNGARLIFGENIQRYAFHESKLRSNITYLQQGEYQTLDRPAIIVQRTTAIEQPFRIIATIVDPADFNLPLVTENNTNVYYFHDKKTALCVLGILSSQFMNFYFRLFNSNTHVASGELNRLPITLESSPFSSQIAIFADRILTAKKTDPSADTTALEAEIDQLVY